MYLHNWWRRDSSIWWIEKGICMFRESNGFPQTWRMKVACWFFTGYSESEGGGGGVWATGLWLYVGTLSRCLSLTSRCCAQRRRLCSLQFWLWAMPFVLVPLVGLMQGVCMNCDELGTQGACWQGHWAVSRWHGVLTFAKIYNLKMVGKCNKVVQTQIIRVD